MSAGPFRRTFETPIISLMTREELLSRIWIDPKRCFGKPCVRGHRIWVSLILDMLATGMKTEEVLAEYPGLEEADVGRVYRVRLGDGPGTIRGHPAGARRVKLAGRVRTYQPPA